MRLAFWRAGKVKDVVQRAVGTPAPVVSAPAAAEPAIANLRQATRHVNAVIE